ECKTGGIERQIAEAEQPMDYLVRFGQQCFILEIEHSGRELVQPETRKAQEVGAVLLHIVKAAPTKYQFKRFLSVNRGFVLRHRAVCVRYSMPRRCQSSAVASSTHDGNASPRRRVSASITSRKSLISFAPSTSGCDAKICSTSVDPERGRLTIRMTSWPRLAFSDCGGVAVANVRRIDCTRSRSPPASPFTCLRCDALTSPNTSKACA